MAEQQRNEQLGLQTTPSPHAPWTLRVASWAWGVAGSVLVLAPLLATLLLWLQYRSLRKNAMRITDLAELFAPPETIDLEPYVAGLESFEAWIANTSGWLLPVVLVLYLVAAAAILAAYVMVIKYTKLGSRTARIFGTAFSVLASAFVFMLWQAFVTVSWLPLDALWSNHLGLVVIALHVLGSVLVWLPASNAFVREVVLRGSTPSLS